MTTDHQRTRRRAQPTPAVIGTVVKLGHSCAPALIASVRDDAGRLLARCCTCGASAPLPDLTRKDDNRS